MLKTLEGFKKDGILAVADLMCTAAITAPKGSGRDTIVCAIVTGEEKDVLRDEMFKLGLNPDHDFFLRDAGNVDKSVCVVLIGCVDSFMGLGSCGQCGFANCGETKKQGAPCTFNAVDLGIAVGSAVSIAADNRIDNRVMFSAGRAAMTAGIMPVDVKVCYGIPLSVNSKSIFYDREPKPLQK